MGTGSRFGIRIHRPVASESEPKTTAVSGSRSTAYFSELEGRRKHLPPAPRRPDSPPARAGKTFEAEQVLDAAGSARSGLSVEESRC